MSFNCLFQDSLKILTFLLLTGNFAWTRAAELTLARSDNWLVIEGAELPKGEIRINYLEAYCRPDSTDADWHDTTIGHTTELVSLSDDKKTMKLRCKIHDGVVVDHTITASTDEVTFLISAHNPTKIPSAAHWAQPCIRLGDFTGYDNQGRDIDDYLPKCFVFLGGQLTRMPDIQPWAKQARYVPGQVWCPHDVPRSDVNPRPLSPLVPSNGLIGCFSGDEKLVFAVAFEPYQELFQGVARCLHSDFRIGGLQPGETKQIRGKIYIVPNDMTSLLARYVRDFPEHHSRLAAQETRPVHPILIRNRYNPLLKVMVEIPAGQTAQLTSLNFSLNGTDDLNDIESLELFVTGDQETFSPTRLIGAMIAPAQDFTAPVEIPLGEGRHAFWLSCQLKDTAVLEHHVSATCNSIVTSDGSFVPQRDSAHAKQRIGVALRRQQDDGVHTYRIPALTTSKNGTLLAVYDMRRRASRDLQEDIDIGLSRSTDGGRTWERPRVIMNMGTFGGLPEEQNGCSDPGIVVDRQTGEIFCFAVWMNGKPGQHQWVEDGSEPGFEIGKSAQFMMVRSTDDGITWSTPDNLTRDLKQESWWLLAPAPQAGISLADGTLVMPVQGRSDRTTLASFATIMTSRDHGQSWAIGQPGFHGGNECQAAQLGDGSIMLNIRNDHERYRAVVVTKDLGQTWQPHPTSRNSLIEPNCNGSLLRFDYERDGQHQHVLLFANPHSQVGRTHHTVQVSFDEGLTWPDSHHWLLDEGLGAGYPSLTRIDGDHVGIVYEGSQAHLVFEKLSIDHLLDPSRRHASAEPGEASESVSD